MKPRITGSVEIRDQMQSRQRPTSSNSNVNLRSIWIPPTLILQLVMAAAPLRASQELFAAYWQVDPGTSTYIELTNNSDGEATVRPVLLLHGVDPVRLPETVIDPLATVRVPLTEILGKQVPIWGAAVLESDTAAIAGWIISHNRARSTLIESSFKPPELAGSHLVAQWWLPHPTAEAFFVIQSLSTTPTQLIPRVASRGSSREGRPITIAPREALRLPLSRFTYLFRERPPAFGAIEFFASGDSAENARLLGRSYIVSRKVGLSIGLEMSRPELNKGTQLQTPGGPAGTVGSDWGFPDGTTFSSTTIVTNHSGDSLELQPTVYGRNASGDPASVTGPSIRLAPHDTQLLDLSWVEQAGVLAPSGFRAAQLAHTGTPKDLTASTFVADSTLSFTFACPFEDVALSSTHKFAVSFDLSTGRTSLLLIKNTSDRSVPFSYLLLFSTDGQTGMWVSNIEVLAPQELRAVNLKSLRNKQVADANGRQLPMDLVKGSAMIVASSSDILGADPTIDRDSRTVVFCDNDCCNDTECPPNCPGPVPTVYNLGIREFVISRETQQSNGKLTCEYRMCQSGVCSSGPWKSTDQSFCYPGAWADIWVTEVDWGLFVIRNCESLVWEGLGFRPC